MAHKVKIVLNSAGIKELLKSSKMAAICQDAAGAYMSRLPPGYEIIGGAYAGKTRVNVSVGPVTDEAKLDNLENNTMLRNL